MKRPDALDRDPEGTVAKARGVYLRALGEAPDDPLTQRAKELADKVAREAERRRLERDAKATKARWDLLTSKPHGPIYELGRNIWYGLPMTGTPELVYPELDNEAALTRGEWFEWASNHKEAGQEALLDHLASILPSREDEEYDDWRARLKARRRAWSEVTDEVAVNRLLFPRVKGESHVAWVRRIRSRNPSGISRIPFVPPRPAGPQSPATSRTGGARSGRKRHPR